MTVHQVISFSTRKNLDDFREVLTPDARPTLGTAENMAAIGQELARYKQITVGPSLLVSAQQGDQGYGHTGDVLRDYKSIVSGAPQEGAPLQEIYTVFLQCKVEYQSVHLGESPENCTSMPDPSGDASLPWITSCSGGSPGYDTVELMELCAIAHIEK